ncbi:chorismate synthase [Candidatus Sumerlaeota bacterium]|nr:chorismate synthase [Candidatus Sumerlaeota bacterium]
MLRYQTAGESHGPQLTAIVSGFPAGVPVAPEDINRDLARRQKGYGRGGRMNIEKDRVQFLSGIRFGLSIGSPITLVIPNLDFQNWQDVMSPLPASEDISRRVTRPRPGHADLPGALKYGHKDARNILERSSARETAARVAVGALCKTLLKQFNIDVFSHVIRIADVQAKPDSLSFDEIKQAASVSDLSCADVNASQRMKKKIDEAKAKGDTVGGVAEIIAMGVPVGLGGVMNWEERLDGILAGAIMSIPSVKGVEIGIGFTAAGIFGSLVHDEIFYAPTKPKALNGHGPSGGFYRKTNNAGGIEGGISNGEPVVIHAAFKPIPTMMTPKRSVDLVTKEPFDASKERSDVCAVPAAAVVAEAMTAFILAQAFIAKFGGDSMGEMKKNYDSYIQYLKRY